MLFHAENMNLQLQQKIFIFIIILVIFWLAFDVRKLPSPLSKQTHPRKYDRLYVSKRSAFPLLFRPYLPFDNASTGER